LARPHRSWPRFGAVPFRPKLCADACCGKQFCLARTARLSPPSHDCADCPDCSQAGKPRSWPFCHPCPVQRCLLDLLSIPTFVSIRPVPVNAIHCPFPPRPSRVRSVFQASRAWDDPDQHRSKPRAAAGPSLPPRMPSAWNVPPRSIFTLLTVLAVLLVFALRRRHKRLWPKLVPDVECAICVEGGGCLRRNPSGSPGVIQVLKTASRSAWAFHHFDFVSTTGYSGSLLTDGRY